MTCPRCGGRGYVGGTECPRCEGAGDVEDERVGSRELEVPAPRRYELRGLTVGDSREAFGIVEAARAWRAMGGGRHIVILVDGVEATADTRAQIEDVMSELAE